MNDSDYDPIQSRLVSVEQKVNLLLVAAVIQVVTVLLSWVHFLYQSMFWTVFLIVIVGGLLYAFRSQLPALSGKFIRFVFSRPGETPDSDREVT